MRENEHIFRSYDIRGIVGKDLDEETMRKIGLAFGTSLKEDIVVAHDCRVHSEKLKNAFAEGFLSSGFLVESTGLLPMGAAVFHAWQNNKDIAYITASHLSKEWNGVKFFHKNGIGYIDTEGLKIKELFFSDIPKSRPSALSYAPCAGIMASYRDFLLRKVSMKRGMNVVIDSGNGCASLFAPGLFRKAGCTVKEIFSDINGNFPNRLPDVVESELSVLKQSVRGADFGIAYDGDGDRMIFVDDRGQFLSVEQMSYIILKELVKKEKGPIVANVECTKIIDAIAEKYGRNVIRVQVGHTFLMNAVNRHKAVFGVERAGHFSLPSVTPVDDALAASFYAAHVISASEQRLSDIRKEIPVTSFERVNYHCPDSVKFDALASLATRLKKDFSETTDIDGIRVNLENGWALLRVSNTGPLIRLTIEGDKEKDKDDIKRTFFAYLSDELSERGIEIREEK